MCPSGRGLGSQRHSMLDDDDDDDAPSQRYYSGVYNPTNSFAVSIALTGVASLWRGRACETAGFDTIESMEVPELL